LLLSEGAQNSSNVVLDGQTAITVGTIIGRRR
jgi:hypothetical protein